MTLAAAAGIAAGGAVVIGLILFGLAMTILWVWMLIEVLTKEPDEGNDKVVWLIVVLLLGHLGGIIYFVARRPQRITQTGQ